MALPDKAIQEFKVIYKAKCGEDLSDDEARIRAENFLNLFNLITTPATKEKQK